MTSESRQWVFDAEAGKFRDQWNDVYDDDPSLLDDDGKYNYPPVHKQILPICGCGDPDRVVDLLTAYLLGLASWPRPFLGHDVNLLLAHMASHVGLTSHGLEIRGAWISPAGHRWLTLAQRYKYAGGFPQ